MNVKLLNLLGALGGRKFIVTVLTSVLLPVISRYVPAETAANLINAVAGVAAAYVFGQSYADGKTNGKTSSVVE